MGEVNLDAAEIKNSRLIQEEASMVELHNGCICCTLRGDLLKTVKMLSEEQAFDYLVIESTGISEPLPVAQTFVMDVEGAEHEQEQEKQQHEQHEQHEQQEQHEQHEPHEQQQLQQQSNGEQQQQKQQQQAGGAEQCTA
mmetsp:Transcript_89199/g.247735  ORF Transcript_89199/g.247735 Transcript_89199/m.247735 type:complete len:139 (+) Transcript_89199:1-417(+)